MECNINCEEKIGEFGEEYWEDVFGGMRVSLDIEDDSKIIIEIDNVMYRIDKVDLKTLSVIFNQRQ